jgi:hypothetical protein
VLFAFTVATGYHYWDYFGWDYFGLSVLNNRLNIILIIINIFLRRFVSKKQTILLCVFLFFSILAEFAGYWILLFLYSYSFSIIPFSAE